MNKLLIGLLLAGGVFYVYSKNSAPATLPATGTPGQTFVLNGVSYVWAVNGVNGFTGATGWVHFDI
jgi:hypothetical protein